MPIDFEKLLKTGGFSNQKVALEGDAEPSKPSFLPKETIQEKKEDKKPKRKAKKANPQPNLKTDIEEEGKINVRSIIETKPPKKVIIDYIKSKIEMFADSDSDSD